MDGLVLSHTAFALNFTPIVITLAPGFYGYRQSNDTFAGSIGDVLYRSTDVSFNSRFVQDYETVEIDFLTPVYCDQLCVMSPKALEIPQWLAIFLCFDPIVWGLIIIMNTICGYLWYILKKWTLKLVIHKTSDH